MTLMPDYIVSRYDVIYIKYFLYKQYFIWAAFN
jgi:hypothetical protein